MTSQLTNFNIRSSEMEPQRSSSTFGNMRPTINIDFIPLQSETQNAWWKCE